MGLKPSSRVMVFFHLCVSQPQVMPASACTGVENWDQAGCPGESIWDEGERMLSVAHKDALWGMSINPIGRRGQQ